MTGIDRTRLPAPAATRSLRFPAIHRAVLSNGLRVAAVDHQGMPIDAFVLVAPAGGAADPAERPGLAALTADLLDEGCGSMSTFELHDALAHLGAHFEIDLGPDAAYLTMSALTRVRDRAIELLADIATTPRLDPEELERVRALRLARLAQLREQPSSLADRTFAAELYGSHPYGHPVGGTRDAVAAATADEIRAFHRRRYALDGCVLVAVGPSPADQLIASVEAAFGKRSVQASREPSAIASDADAVAGAGPRVAIVHRAHAVQSELRVGHVAAARRTPDYHALITLNAVLGGQFVSRLNLKLREQKGYTYGVRTAFEMRRMRGPFAMATAVQADATADSIAESLGEMRALADARPATPEELEMARASLTLGYARGFETVEQIARGVAQLSLHELPDDTFEQFVPRVNAVTGADVQRVAREYLHPDASHIIVVGDADALRPSIEDLGIGPIVLVDPPL